jgi:hypothetical protein
MRLKQRERGGNVVAAMAGERHRKPIPGGLRDPESNHGFHFQCNGRPGQGFKARILTFVTFYS